MRWIESPGRFTLLLLLGFWVLFFSFWGVIFNKTWIFLILASYAVLLILSVVLIFLKSAKPASTSIIEEFEKTLSGRLYHFKCPSCNGVFALKKSKRNNKKTFKITCPDCGKMGVISPLPRCVEEEIPDKKSVNINFKCTNCGEFVTVWAEGAELYSDIRVFSCPYCGIEKNMNRI